MCLTLCDFMNYSPQEFHGILQARILEWVAIPISRESSQPRDQIYPLSHQEKQRRFDFFLFCYRFSQARLPWQEVGLLLEGCACVCACSVSHVRLFGPMDYSLPGYSVNGISQAGILEWVALSCSRGSYWPRDQHDCPALAGGIFTAEPPGKSLCRVWLVPVESVLEDTVSSENPPGGCWMWFLSSGGWGCSQRTGSAVLLVAPDCSAGLSICAFDTSMPSWIAVLGAMILHWALWAEMSTQPLHTRESCLMGRLWGLSMKHPVSKWNSTQHKRSDKKLDFILLPRFYFYSQGIVDDCFITIQPHGILRAPTYL